MILRDRRRRVWTTTAVCRVFAAGVACLACLARQHKLFVPGASAAQRHHLATIGGCETTGDEAASLVRVPKPKLARA